MRNGNHRRIFDLVFHLASHVRAAILRDDELRGFALTEEFDFDRVDFEFCGKQIRKAYESRQQEQRDELTYSCHR